MCINPNDTISGINIVKIRNFLRRSGRSERWRADYISSLLHLNEEQTLGVLTELEGMGYIEKDKFEYGEQYWHNTVRGNALGNASAAKPYKLRGQQLEKRRDELEKSGKRLNSIVEWAGAAQTEIWSFLKSRSRIISMHIATEELFDLTGGKVIFDGTQASLSS